jgi:hypothetical protein
MTSPDPFRPQGPVDWALGKVLIESVLKPLLYALWPDRVDPRDWMRPRELEFELQPSVQTAEGRDYWFDFIADTGDSDVAAYSISYLLHGDLSVGPDVASLLSGDHPRLEKDQVIPVKVDRHATGARVLPRGQFLFVGGDTAYPVADSLQIDHRFVQPMNYAFKRRFPESSPEARPLFAIPGNHDWYDSLDGYNRVFRRPAPALEQRSDETGRPLTPEGYCALQDASYFALQLPGNWWFWACDARDGPDMDYRQRAYFEQLLPRQDGRLPHLLLATPNPPFVNGVPADWVRKLKPNLPDAALPLLRLWFSGDTHHYARYDQVEPIAGYPVTSLVSGLGGAALHSPLPGGKQSEATFPDVARGQKAVLKRLLDPFHMVSRPGLRGLAGVLGLCLGAGAIARAPSKPSDADPSLEHVSRVALGADAAPVQSLVFLLTALAVAGLIYKILGPKRPENQRRQLPLKKRLGGFVFPILLLVFAGVLLALGGDTFGHVVLGSLFDLAVLLLVCVLPLLLVLGLPKIHRAPWRYALLIVAALLLGATTIGGSIVVARRFDALLQAAGWTSHWLSMLRTVAAPIAAAGVQLVVFPILSGWLLAAAFVLRTQRAFISSFATVDQFAAFIRFRLRVREQETHGTLTGFVIGVSQVVPRGSLLDKAPENAPVPEARLIDVFTVRQ